MRFPFHSLPLAALLAACTATRTVERADLSPPNAPARVWVTRTDHTTLVFDSARVSADSLIGMVNGTPQRLLLSEGTVLRARKPSPDRTAALVGLPAFGAALLLTLYFVNKPGSVDIRCVPDYKNPGEYLC